MCGRKVKDMLMAWIAQKCPPLPTSAEVFGDKGHLAPLGDQAADVETPVGVEIIHHPIVTLHSWQLLDDIGHMGGEIGTGTCWAQIPHDLTRCHGKRSDQHPGPMTDVLMLAFFRFAGFNGLGRVFALKNLHTGLFIGAEDQTALLKETLGIDI